MQSSVTFEIGIGYRANLAQILGWCVFFQKIKDKIVNSKKINLGWWMFVLQEIQLGGESRDNARMSRG